MAGRPLCTSFFVATIKWVRVEFDPARNLHNIVTRGISPVARPEPKRVRPLHTQVDFAPQLFGRQHVDQGVTVRALLILGKGSLAVAAPITARRS
jgi:hypothetical protein